MNQNVFAYETIHDCFQKVGAPACARQPSSQSAAVPDAAVDDAFPALTANPRGRIPSRLLLGQLSRRRHRHKAVGTWQGPLHLLR